jgi:hypothetical protein
MLGAVRSPEALSWIGRIKMVKSIARYFICGLGYSLDFECNDQQTCRISQIEDPLL